MRGEEKNVLYRADKSSQGRIKISCNGTRNQPRKGPFHLYSISLHFPQFQHSAAEATPLDSLIRTSMIKKTLMTSINFGTTLMKKTCRPNRNSKQQFKFRPVFVFSALSLIRFTLNNLFFILFYSNLIIYKESTVAMLEGGVGVQDGVVRLHNRRRHLHTKNFQMTPESQSP